MKRTYLAMNNSTEFEFVSEHRAGSAANRKDAEAASRRKYGRVIDIQTIQLAEKPDDRPIAPFVKDLSLTETEAEAIRAGFAAGKLTCAYMGAKIDGLIAFGDIKTSHGWSWNDFQRAAQAVLHRDCSK